MKLVEWLMAILMFLVVLAIFIYGCAVFGACEL